MFNLDLPGAAVSLYKVIREDRELQGWLRLIFSTGFSGYLGLCGGWGGALALHVAPWPAFGAGLLGSAVSVLSVLTRSQQARSLLISVPQPVIQKYQAEGETVIEPEAK